MTPDPRRPRKISIFGLVSKHEGRNRGGTATCIRRLAGFCAAKGLQVDVLIGRQSGDPLLSAGLPSGINVIQVDGKNKLGLFCALVRHVVRTRPDVLLALDTRASLIASWLAHVPLHNTRIWSSFHRQLNSDHKRLLKRIASRSTGVIVVSRGLGEEFARLTGVAPERVQVLHNLVVTPEMEALSRAPVDHPWLQDRTSPVLIGVGRLVTEKGFEFLIKAMTRVVDIHPSARLIILGQGPLLGPLRDLAEQSGLGEKVDFAGFRDNPWAYMAKASLLVMPSLHEAFGNVLAEALSLGVPVVATNCPHGPAEILQNGRYGRLVAPADSEALAGAILDTLASSLPRETLMEAARRFGEETAGQQYLQTLGLDGGAASATS